MSGRGALQRKVDRLERELMEVRKLLGNRPSRRPAPKLFKFTVDHTDHKESTRINEKDVREAGWSHDMMKVVESPRAKSSTDSTPNKLAASIAQAGGHDEGWVWGNVAYSWGTKGFSHGSYDEYGWGLWADVIGIEKEGFKYVNLMTWARWNNGLDDEDRKVGPIYFDSDEDGEEPGDGAWYLGKMIYDGFWWRPGFKGRGHDLIYAKTRIPTTPSDLPVLHADHCPVFREPRRYRILEGFKVWTLGAKGGKVNVHQVAACNRDHINGLWDFMAVLDWHTADIMGWHDNFLDNMWKGAGTNGLMGTWVAAVDTWAQTVDALLSALSAFHPTTAALYATESASLAAEVSAAAAVAGFLPYVTKCPLPSGAHQGDYFDDGMKKCKQVEEK